MPNDCRIGTARSLGAHANAHALVKRRLLGPLMLCCGTLALWGTATVGGLQVNFTTSIPRGFYRIAGQPVQQGSMVLACLPGGAAKEALARGYVWPGRCPGGAAPIGKYVLAAAGDTVALGPEGLRCNGRWVPNGGVLARDSHGRVLIHFPYGVHEMAAHEVWIYSPHEARSYDSRYFGPLPLELVRATIVPVLVFGPKATIGCGPRE